MRICIPDVRNHVTAVGSYLLSTIDRPQTANIPSFLHASTTSRWLLVAFRGKIMLKIVDETDMGRRLVW